MNKKTPRVRIPPSPTGNLHIGTARTALFNFFFAKKYGGSIVLRIEDTDTLRNKKEFETNIVEGLEWLGISYDEFYRQSERKDVYKKFIKELIDSGKAFVSKEKSTKEGEEGKEIEIIRMKNPGKDVTFQDIIRGEVTFNTTELGDFVLARSMEEPLYHLAVVVDDFDMSISHIIRGEDHISNTARQILIQEAIGAPRPIYAHIPLILAPDKSKLSKRYGAVSIDEYRQIGYLKEALINYLALLGWNPGTEEEIFTMDELIEEFSLEKVQKGGAIFNEEKLRWINKKHIERLDEVDRNAKIEEIFLENSKHKDKKIIKLITPLILEKIHVWSDIKPLIEAGEFDFFFIEPEYSKELLLWKKEKDLSNVKRLLEETSNILKEIPENDFNSIKIKEAVWDFAEKEGRGSVLWPFRVALTGKEKSPDPFIVSEIIGKEESIQRIKSAIDKIL